ncbi:MAG: SpoIIE family protein phosphatase, partial [Deltaproteobacteria bacterium]|nr:SpoIIE family protein phosphatase [Deltaproteobacteria bacterium]
AEDLARMSSMPQVYQTLQGIQPELFLWQYTALESGIHSSYPGKGGYPAEYDPRKRQWYQDAVAQNGTIQQLLTDLTTGSLILTLAQPLHTVTGELLGVTALDIDYRQFFSDWKIPEDWADITESMVLIFDKTAANPAQQLEILLRNNRAEQSTNWQVPVKHEYLDISVPELLPVKEDILNGHSAVRKITYHGQQALWAYGSREEDAPFPLVIVPYERVLAKAVNAENAVNQQISLGLRISAGLTVFVVIAVIILTLIRSRKVTQPVSQLAAAAKLLAEGDFTAKVNIHTGDELENLGDIFNGMGSRLKERESMLQSLALAKEIQQQLLPVTAPACPGFELAGKSLYCDETGGDYFDFVALQPVEKNMVGLAVGDVSGHGIGAALVMAAARGILRSLADRHTTELNPLFDNLNLHLSRDTADAYFMTLFYGILDPEKMELRWLSAGHAPVFLYQKDLIVELDSSGIPLGIIEKTDYDPTSTIHFTTGDMLLIGTDGIWETRADTGEMFGTERVCQLLTEHKDLNADSIAEKILAALALFRGDCPQDDDVTLIIVKTT